MKTEESECVRTRMEIQNVADAIKFVAIANVTQRASVNVASGIFNAVRVAKDTNAVLDTANQIAKVSRRVRHHLNSSGSWLVLLHLIS